MVRLVVRGPAALRRPCGGMASTPASSAAQRCCCSSSSGVPSPPPPSFRSATNFKLAPTQVNETNVPTAREVKEMIPTLRELRAQLPEARELEQRYIRPEAVAATGGEGTAVAPSATIFQPTTDPLEDLLFGPPKAEAAAEASQGGTRPRRQHLLLAYRALLWGTAYALIGFAATVALAMYACGFHSIAELRAGVRGKLARDEARLRASAGEGADASAEHYVIDLTHPAEAWRQAQEVWAAVQRMAEEEDAKAQRSAES